MVYDDGIPTHPFTVGVTEIVAEMGDEPEFVAAKPGIFPVPFAPNPIAVFEFVQVNDPPEGDETKLV